MQKFFTSLFHFNNRAKLLEQADEQIPIVLAGHGLLQRNADNSFPFQQDSNFWYLTGIPEPDVLLVMHSKEAFLIIPGRSLSREAFDGSIDTNHLAKVSGISDIVEEDEGWRRLKEILQSSIQVQTMQAPPQYIEQYGLYTNPARSRLIDRIKSIKDDIDIIDIRQQLVSLRMIKQPEELQAIQAAIDTTVAGMTKVMKPGYLASCSHEFEVESALTAAFRTEIADGHAFAPIIACGKRAVTLHNVRNSGRLQSGELLVIDVGAEVSHYAADITRTVAVGKPSRRQQEVFDAVLDVQRYALELLKPGTMLKEYEAAVEMYMGQKLVQLGLISDRSHENIRKFYPHATSHFLGLDVHDVGDYERALEPGMVLTCEPGIYIPDEGIGVRIEDDILITKNGNPILSDDLPRNLTAYA